MTINRKSGNRTADRTAARQRRTQQRISLMVTRTAADQFNALMNNSASAISTPARRDDQENES